MGQPSPTFHMYIQLCRYLFLNVTRIFILRRRKFRMIFLCIIVWVWGHICFFFQITFELKFMLLLAAITYIYSVYFLELGIADLIISFQDVHKVLHGFYSLFKKWHLEDYKSLRKLSDLGFLLKETRFCWQLSVHRFFKIYFSGTTTIIQMVFHFFYFWNKILCFFF